MKNNKIIETLDKFNSDYDVINFSELQIFDCEYLLKYLEISQDKLKQKYRHNFDINWKVKLSISFLILYKKYLNTYDIRILNLLIKSINIIRTLDIKYNQQEVYKLLTIHLNKLKK